MGSIASLKNYSGLLFYPVTIIECPYLLGSCSLIMAPMITFAVLRQLGSTLAFNFFGYFCPAFSSIKAVLSKDIEGIQEYLTYWSVFGFILYLETLVKYGSASVIARYPPEFKVLLILWLTLPRFQGAFRIYMLILKPYFEKNEKEIDKLVATSVGKVQMSVGGYLQNLMYHLVIESNKSFLASLMTASKPAEPSANDVVVGGLKTALGMLNGVGAATTAADEDTPVRKGHRHGHGHVNLLLEFCHLLQAGVVVATPRFEFARVGANWSASYRDEDCTSLERCVLLLNGHKNVLLVRYQGNGAATTTAVAAQAVSNATGLCVPLWSISQVCIDEVDVDGADGAADETKVQKCLLLDTCRPASSFKTTAGTTNFHGSTVTSLTVRASIAARDSAASAGADEAGEDIDPVQEGNELLDSIGYGLPMLIQQYKSNISKRCGRLEKLLVAKQASRPSVFEFGPSRGPDCKDRGAQEAKDAVGSSSRPRISSDLGDSSADSKSGCARGGIEGAKGALAMEQRNLSTAFLMWKLAIVAGYSAGGRGGSDAKSTYVAPADDKLAGSVGATSKDFAKS
jgi:hypothetical protein